MTLLVVGLVVFLGIHLVPALPALRKSLLAGMGERGYKGMFSAASLAGLVLIVFGYARAPASDQLFRRSPRPSPRPPMRSSWHSSSSRKPTCAVTSATR